jgi:hypothetical protein
MLLILPEHGPEVGAIGEEALDVGSSSGGTGSSAHHGIPSHKRPDNQIARGAHGAGKSYLWN